MKKLPFLFFVSILLFSCDPEKTTVKPAHTGAAGEIIVICPDSVWNNGLDSSMIDLFEYYLPMLPRPEVAFNVGHYTPEQFTMIIERHRNVFVIKTDNKRPENQATYNLYKDRWAKNQIALEIEAKNTSEAIKKLEEHQQEIIDVINRKENERLAGIFGTYPAKGAMSVVKKSFDISLTFPKGFEVSKEGENFMWLKREKSRNLGGNMYYVIQNLTIYTHPYSSEASFADSSLLAQRDQFVSNIPGPSEGSYMTTVYAFEDMDLYPIGKDVNIDGNYGRELRGLWKMENDFMGGPFVSVSTYDEKNKRIITIDGQVFGPKFDKREYLRELESIIYSIKLNKE